MGLGTYHQSKDFSTFFRKPRFTPRKLRAMPGTHAWVTLGLTRQRQSIACTQMLAPACRTVYLYALPEGQIHHSPGRMPGTPAGNEPHHLRARRRHATSSSDTHNKRMMWLPFREHSCILPWFPQRFSLGYDVARLQRAPLSSANVSVEDSARQRRYPPTLGWEIVFPSFTSGSSTTRPFRRHR